MSKKKSIKLTARTFCERADAILGYAAKLSPHATQAEKSWIYDYAVIRLYREFESLMLEALVGAINHDSKTLSANFGVDFPKHMSNAVCEFVVTGGRYFDFKGRDGLTKLLKRFIPSNHYLVVAVNDARYKDALDRIVALRNFAAHDSEQARKKAKEALGLERLASSGTWLKRQKRFDALVDSLKRLAREIERGAPH